MTGRSDRMRAKRDAPIQPALENIRDDRVWQQVSERFLVNSIAPERSRGTGALDSLNAHAAPDEEPDLGTRDVVVDELLYDNDVFPIVVKNVVAEKEGPDVGSGPLNDKAAKVAEDDVQLMSEVRFGQQLFVS